MRPARWYVTALHEIAPLDRHAWGDWSTWSPAVLARLAIAAARLEVDAGRSPGLMLPTGA